MKKLIYIIVITLSIGTSTIANAGDHYWSLANNNDYIMLVFDGSHGASLAEVCPMEFELNNPDVGCYSGFGYDDRYATRPKYETKVTLLFIFKMKDGNQVIHKIKGVTSIHSSAIKLFNTSELSEMYANDNVHSLKVTYNTTGATSDAYFTLSEHPDSYINTLIDMQGKRLEFSGIAPEEVLKRAGIIN